MTGRPVDPTGKAALFGPGVSSPPDQLAAGPSTEGKAALFSMTRRRSGTVVIECARCKGRSRVSLADLGMRLASGSAWLPVRRHQHWLRCPSCDTRQWCRIGWLE